MHVSELPFSFKFSDISQYNSQSSMCRVLLASCNGLVMYKLFSRGRGNLPEYYISNPWTREYVSLPKPSKGNAFHYGLAFENNPINSNSYSLGINNNNNNVALFKIVAANRIENCHHISAKRIDYTFKFEVYSSDINRWQLLGSTFKLKPHLHDRSPELGRENAIHCNRVLYWQCCENNAFMFNLETEAPGN
ncbi:hypothetical protein MRB53_027662 [Persea americana]|uniref:Uncharacterized protein n=1 Tax=Persea americana TaxID=3435 RepID=A0ACC2LMR6_PERAE|nr:hypothetical protein MRB53_027662 [Persea americana]